MTTPSVRLVRETRSNPIAIVKFSHEMERANPVEARRWQAIRSAALAKIESRKIRSVLWSRRLGEEGVPAMLLQSHPLYRLAEEFGRDQTAGFRRLGQGKGEAGRG